MLFMLMASDVADSTEARLAARSAHLARLEKLAEAGRLVLAGPCPLPEGETGFSGSLNCCCKWAVNLAATSATLGAGCTKSAIWVISSPA